MASIKLALGDSQLLFAEGFRELILNQNEHKIEIVGLAASLEKINEILNNKEVDILFLEVNMGGKNSLNSIPELKEEYPNLKICVISSYIGHNFVKRALINQADGFYSKYSPQDELADCISELLNGNIFLSSGLEITPSRNGKKSSNENNLKDRFLLQDQLTPREHEVLELIASALNNKEIAEKLYISDQTVSVHRKNIMRKFGVKNTVNLIKFTFDHQLVH